MKKNKNKNETMFVSNTAGHRIQNSFRHLKNLILLLLGLHLGDQLLLLARTAHISRLANTLHILTRCCKSDRAGALLLASSHQSYFPRREKELANLPLEDGSNASPLTSNRRRGHARIARDHIQRRVLPSQILSIGSDQILRAKIGVPLVIVISANAQMGLVDLRQSSLGIGQRTHNDHTRFVFQVGKKRLGKLNHTKIVGLTGQFLPCGSLCVLWNKTDSSIVY